jgi:signal recognition particle receptor subunit beta
LPTFTSRLVDIKIVYYGCALCGKTTNLQRIHSLIRSDLRGKLMSMSNVKDDRTIFFDLLPIQVPLGGGYRLSAKLYTVPGQTSYSHTRKLVLQNVDGIVFVADSQREMARANGESFQDLQRNLRDLKIDPATLPMVVQFNKRDLPDVRPMAELEAAWKARGIPVLAASAMRSEGVVETLEAVLLATFRGLVERVPLMRRLGLSEETFLSGVRRNFAPEEMQPDGSGAPSLQAGVGLPPR